MNEAIIDLVVRDYSEWSAVVRKSESMRIFADGEDKIVFVEWKGWECACEKEGSVIPPAEFKARSDEQKREYLKEYVDV